MLQLALSLDLEGRYLLLSCMANGLRYPNFHTYYFGCVLLWMFHEAGAVPDGDSQMLQEQLTRSAEWSFHVVKSGVSLYLYKACASAVLLLQSVSAVCVAVSIYGSVLPFTEFYWSVLSPTGPIHGVY